MTEILDVIDKAVFHNHNLGKQNLSDFYSIQLTRVNRLYIAWSTPINKKTA